MESGGPYAYSPKRFGVVGPGIDVECILGAEYLNLAYKEGRKSVKINTPCPSCGFTTLYVDCGGNLVCSFLECENPTQLAKQKPRRTRDEVGEANRGYILGLVDGLRKAASIIRRSSDLECWVDVFLKEANEVKKRRPIDLKFAHQRTGAW